MTADIDFYVDLAQRCEGPLVELAVGDGRVAVPVAEATGRPVIGIDTSARMLAKARVRAAAAGVHLDLHEVDMRDLDLPESAGLVYCPYRALLHLPTWADRRRTFQRVADLLRPGGRFAWNAFAFDHHSAARLDGRHEPGPVPHTLRYAVGDNRLDIVTDSGATSSLWWATKNEWLGLTEVAGLEVEALRAKSSTACPEQAAPLDPYPGIQSDARHAAMFSRFPNLSDSPGIRCFSGRRVPHVYKTSMSPEVE